MAGGLKAVGLFAGIGGIELGLESAGFETIGLCEIDEAAQRVLMDRWPAVQHWADVRALSSLPTADIVTAGFPCQDLSQAGRKAGITGAQSGLVGDVIRLMRKRGAPHTLILENVSYMLRLDGGRGMDYLVGALEDLNMRWAYRVVDARAFGLPQRRRRVLLVASHELDPAATLLSEDAGREFNPDDAIGAVDPAATYGFYWTEGLRGLGWAKEAVPTVKGGSGLGIPSPPAIWEPLNGSVGTPSLGDAERLQGFSVDWTLAAEVAGSRRSVRWKLVGNAVSVPMAAWLGRRLTSAPGGRLSPSLKVSTRRWPDAAYGYGGKRICADVSAFPLTPAYRLSGFLGSPLRPLSVRATRGFLERARRGKLRFPDGFLASLDEHVSRLEGTAA